MGSWTVSVGDMDQALHLWRYTGGFEKVDENKRELKNDPVSVFFILIIIVLILFLQKKYQNK